MPRLLAQEVEAKRRAWEAVEEARIGARSEAVAELSELRQQLKSSEAERRQWH